MKQGVNKYNNRYIIDSGYKCTFKSKTKGGFDVYRCVVRTCKASINIPTNTEEGSTPLNIYQYNSQEHSPFSEDQITISNFYSEAKERALNSYQTPTTLTNDILSLFPQRERTILPSPITIKIQITKHRKIADNYLPNRFGNLQEYILGFNNQKFIQYQDEHFLIVLNSENIERMANSICLLVDGTFKCCPSPYFQLFIINFYVYGKAFHGCYILMKNKSESLYFDVFYRLKFVLKSSKVKYIVMDFELAIKNSSKSLFPDAIICYCIFRFRQIIWKNVQSLGLTSIYKNDLNFKNYVRMFLCIGFEPEHRMQKDFIALETQF